MLELFRDRVVHRSQIGRLKLDRVATRRRIEEALLDLGRRVRLAVDAGRMQVPEDIQPAVEELRSLERQLKEQQKGIAELEREHPSGSGET